MTLEDMTNSKNKRQQLSSFVRGQIIGMHMLNGKATQISAILSIPISTVKYVIRHYIQKGMEVPPRCLGRPKSKNIVSKKDVKEPKESAHRKITAKKAPKKTTVRHKKVPKKTTLRHHKNRN
ncbi:unnamed protein product [Rhizopus stolonifer]